MKAFQWALSEEQTEVLIQAIRYWKSHSKQISESDKEMADELCEIANTVGFTYTEKES